MREESATWFVCAGCGGPIGAYEPCLVEKSGELIETSLLSLNAAERRDAGAKAVYHSACRPRPATDARPRRVPARDA
jgi:hypothetical protein